MLIIAGLPNGEHVQNFSALHVLHLPVLIQNGCLVDWQRKSL